MRKATLRKYKSVKQSQRIIRPKRKIKKEKGVKKSVLEEKVQGMGYTTKVNKRISEMMIDDNQMQEVYTKQLPTIEITEEMDLETGEITKVEKKQNKLNVDQKAAIENLQNKYKNDFKQMQMDNKLNPFVWNQNQCKKMYNRYLQQFQQFP